MMRRTLQLELLTPAFLGTADQTSEWRTPPIKSLLRQFWRIACARSLGYDVGPLRELEGRIFGAASDKNGGSSQSLVRLSLSAWERGTLNTWQRDGRVDHPEVDRGPVGSSLYLGYGPLIYEKGRGRTGLKKPPAMNAGQRVDLRLIVRRGDVPGLDDAVALAAYLGTLGGRSRNGWGSLLVHEGGQAIGLLNEAGELAPGAATLADRYARPLDEALRTDWPHALGRDADSLLLWRTQRFGRTDWLALMSELARVKITFRTQLAFPSEAEGPFRQRHLLAYPVTSHQVRGWKDARLANQLRFKVVLAGDGLYGVAFHIPAGLPRGLAQNLRSPPSPNDQAAIWRRVHAVLDKEMVRLGGPR